MEDVSYFVLGIGLIAVAAIDIAKKRIPIWVLGLLGATGVVLRVYQENLFKIELIYSIIPGLVLVGICLISDEIIGYGDAFLVVVVGIFSNWRLVCGTILISTTMCGMVGLVLMLLLKKKRDYEIAFVPFLLAGYVIAGCLS